ncbi:sensor histidine kinase [Pseudoduganella sp. HUAS MS19]
MPPLLADYSHTQWGAQDGAPNDVVQFAQTADGWLWLASPSGLYRFDGVRFERVDQVRGQRLQSTSVLGLLGTPDGGLWVGHRFGGVSHVKNQRVTLHKPGAGLPNGAVMSIARGPDGAIWVSTSQGLGHLAPGAERFTTVSSSGLPQGLIYKVLFSRSGIQWVATAGGAYYRKPGAQRYQPAWPSMPMAAMDEAPDGTIWASDGVDKHYRLYMSRPSASARPQPVPGGTGIHFDRDGVMWVLKLHALERRVAPYLAWPAPALDQPPAAQQLGRQNGLPGWLPQMWFQDREGNIWIGSSTGIDRLRRNQLRPLVSSVALSRPGVIADTGGRVFIGDQLGPLRSADKDGLREVAGPMPLGASHRAPDGTLWVGDHTHRWRRTPGGKWIGLPLPPLLKGSRVLAMQTGRDGRMWVSMQKHGLFRVDGEQWQRGGGLPGLPTARALALARDADGRIWIGYVGGAVACVDGDRVRLYGQADGLKLGHVQSLLTDGARIWAGGEFGLAYLDGNRWLDVAVPARGVSGMARTPDGELWLHGADGVARIGAQEVQRLLAEPGSPVAFERFDGPGSRGGAEQVGPLPSLVQGTDGRLWFTTPSQVSSIDPRRIPRNPLAPPVQIVSLRAAGKRYDGAQIALPVGTGELEINYTALGLLMPERMHFQYRLHGLDTRWHDAGNRRNAVFNNLGPGTYRFQVIAANEDGVWNRDGAQATITIPPRFVQTGWFAALLAMLGALALYLLYRLRLRQITRRMNGLMHARLAERARIARGLHDTLLQSVQSLIMFFDMQARSLPQDREREKIEQTLKLADQLMVEGRDCILDLRTAAEPRELGQALRDYGGVLLHERLTVAVQGRPRELKPQVRDELYAIAREALFNCARHAGATRVELTLDYGRDSVVITISDDGCGGARERVGHYGLAGMRERAGSVGAALTIASTAGEGTSVGLRIAAGLAYADMFSPGLFARWRRRPLVQQARACGG